MKKYKLIKKYPGSPKLDHIIQSNLYEKYVWIDDFKTYLIDKSNIEEYPEYWEEVIEKEYEIISFEGIGTYNKGLFILNNETKRYDFYNYKKVLLSKIDVKLKGFNNILTTRIYSVKRLSDGEVFTIGDKITSSNIVNDRGFIITEFAITNDILFPCGINRSCTIGESIKAKPPLFTTEDGVDIFEDNLIDLYYLRKDFSYKLYEADIAKIVGYDTTHMKWFLAKEAVKEYILLNKPCLSINDISRNCSIYTNITILKELVKSKL